MCNACGIYYKNHGRHRPVELALAPQRTAHVHAAPAAPAHHCAADSEEEVEPLHGRAARARRASLPHATG